MIPPYYKPPVSESAHVSKRSCHPLRQERDGRERTSWIRIGLEQRSEQGQDRERIMHRQPRFATQVCSPGHIILAELLIEYDCSLPYLSQARDSALFASETWLPKSSTTRAGSRLSGSFQREEAELLSTAALPSANSSWILSLLHISTQDTSGPT